MSIYETLHKRPSAILGMGGGGRWCASPPRHGEGLAVVAGAQRCTGTLTLSGNNTYNGATNVTAGKLIINGSTSSTSLVTVDSGATLGGSGTVGGNISIADTGKLEFDITTAPGSHDGLVLGAGALNFVSTSSLTIKSISGGTTGSYVLITAPNGITGADPAILNLPSGWVANVTKEVGDTQLVLNVTSTGGGDTTPPTFTSISDDVSAHSSAPPTASRKSESAG